MELGHGHAPVGPSELGVEHEHIGVLVCNELGNVVEERVGGHGVEVAVLRQPLTDCFAQNWVAANHGDLGLCHVDSV